MASYASRYARAFVEVIFEEKLNAKDMQRQLGDFAASVAREPRTEGVFPRSVVSPGTKN